MTFFMRALYRALLLLFFVVCISTSTAAAPRSDVTAPPAAGTKNATGTEPRTFISQLRRPSSIARTGGVFLPGKAAVNAEAARSEHEYYSYEYSDEPLSNDNNGSERREAVSWLVPDPDQITTAEEAEDDTAEEEVELPDNSLADGDLHDHDMMDSVMYIYFGPNPRAEGGANAQVVLAGTAVALFAQVLTALTAVRKALRARCRRSSQGGSLGVNAGSLQAAMVLLHTELALATASLVFIFSVHGTADTARCQAVSLLLHYLHLSAACWLTANCVRVFLWLAQEAAPPHERPAPPTKAPGLQALAVAAWALPLLLVLASFLAHPQGYEARRYCWLSVHKGMLVSFLAPVAALITANTALAVLGVRRAPHKLHSSSSEDAARLSLRLSAGVVPLFAVSWFFSVLALEQPQSLAAALLFAATSAIFNWFLFACSGSLFPDCPVSPLRSPFHPLALPSGPHCTLSGHHVTSSPPSPSQHDAQPLLPATTSSVSRGWSQGWTPRTHPEIPSSPARRATWRERDVSGRSGAMTENDCGGAVSLGVGGEDDLEAEETSELLELRLENISTIST